MRLVRAGEEPSEVGADVRVTLTALGAGADVLGGVALLGCKLPEADKPVDAIIVLPRGVLVVVGVDLGNPAMKLEAPLQTPWTVDGWPLVRSAGAVNPGLDALTAASTVASHVQAAGAEPLPVAAIVAVGPYVGQVTQPTIDLQRGLRVLHPSSSSLLPAARELATYPYSCPVEAVRQLLKALDPEAAKLDDEALAAEGFPETAEQDPAAAQTLSIPKVNDSASSGMPAIRVSRNAPRIRIPPLPTGMARVKLITLATMVLSFCVLFGLLAALGGAATSPQVPQPVALVDGVSFSEVASQRDINCAQHSFGDVQAWLQKQPCTGLTRVMFTATVAGRPAAVAVAVVRLGDLTGAEQLRGVLDTAGSGGISDLTAEGHHPAGVPASFDGSAQTIEQDGPQVRVVDSAWAAGASQPTDIELRALAERGLRLPTGQ